MSLKCTNLDSSPVHDDVASSLDTNSAGKTTALVLFEFNNRRLTASPKRDTLSSYEHGNEDPQLLLRASTQAFGAEEHRRDRIKRLLLSRRSADV